LRVSGVNSDAEFLFKRHDDLIEVDAVSPRVSELASSVSSVLRQGDGTR
jgi:hypothetical protein